MKKLKELIEFVGLMGTTGDLLLLAMMLGALLGAIALFHHHNAPPEPTVTQVAPGVRTIQAPGPITERTVTKTIVDPAQAALIKALLAENAKLKADVTNVTVATVESESTGGGAVTEQPATATEPAGIHFTDWRLDFIAAGNRAQYTLKQRFEIVTSTGRQKDGTPVALAHLYELGPGDARTELHTTQTTGLFTDDTVPHWYRGLGIQGGVAASRAASGEAAVTGIGMLQWLSHGRTKAAEDTSYTVLAPAVVIGSGVQDFGIVPFAVNLGRLPHQPFTNVWAGVFVAKSQRVGVTLTARF